MARTGVIYGESGTGKTTAIADLARYGYEKTGKKTLLFSFDGGGWAPCAPMIDLGIISAFRPAYAVPLPVIRVIGQGYWPVNPEAEQFSEMDFRRVDWSDYGYMAVEGLTSISNTLMRHLADNKIKTGEDATSPFAQRIRIDGEVREVSFAGNSKAHYGFQQNQVEGMVNAYGTLPLDYVLFTALEKKGRDDAGNTVYGPAVSGKQATINIPGQVGDLIHAQGYTEKVGPEGGETFKQEVRYYFRRHPDPDTGLEFPAKPRVSKDRWAELEQRYPGGYFLADTMDSGFGDYLREMDRMGLATDRDRAWREAVDKKFGRTTGTVVDVKV